MSQTTMYPAMVNSPSTTLTSGITSSATTIPVAELGGFPAAPNTATLKNGVNSETVLYTGKSASSGAGNLTGCTRGWNVSGSYGAARSWSSGATIARTATAYDFDTLKANITDHETNKAPLASPALTGTPTAPTAPTGTNTTQIATTAFVLANAGVTWTEVTGTTQQAAINNGYLCNNASRVTVTLPATAAVGTVIEVAGKGAGGWKIAQNAGQSIQFANVTSTTGTGGYLQSISQFDKARLVCTTANTVFAVVSSVGFMEMT